MKQYWDIKAAHQDKILLFRMGDFFEIFHDDATTVAPLVGITLTVRNKKSGDQTPMCGVPHHSIAGPINKLLAAGYKIAICDQIEDPALAKGLVKRAVTRILSPGMVFDPDTLDADQFNYMAAFDEKTVGFVEPTTGETFYYEYKTPAILKKIMLTISPVELVISEEQKPMAEELFGKQFVLSVHDGKRVAYSSHLCLQRVVSYATHMQSEEILKTLGVPELRSFEERLHLSQDVLRHLEIFKTYKGETAGTLYSVINKTKTAGGSRRLKQWLMFPLTEARKIEARWNQIAWWLDHLHELRSVRESLQGIGDFERKLGKISQPNAHPRDLQSLADTFGRAQQIFQIFSDHEEDLRSMATWKNEIDKTFEEDIPLNFRETGFIRRGVSADLDELIELSTNSQAKVLELEAKEKELTQISSLKVRYNNVFGYYIEVTNTHTSKVPLQRYQRKQTLTNAERYTTDELVELERKVITARTRRAELEMEIYQRLKNDLLQEMSQFLKIAHFCNDLDVITSLAWLALDKNYCRPQIATEQVVDLRSSRHPVIEEKVSFVPNDIRLGRSECMLLTGPNMAGKSTIMRQVAIAAILCQMGSYVPATSAELPLFDRIFTRIGASDFLTEGLSTFMVEMKETAEMLRESTEKSLVVLDEVGRGTSTYDGLSLAQSILEFLLEKTKPLVLFATHYHELTALEVAYAQLKNAHMLIHEKKEELQFLYTLKPGSAQKSYGIQVAQLAGMPQAVIRRAQALLKSMESNQREVMEKSHSPQLDLWSRADVEEKSTPEDSAELALAKELLRQMQEAPIQSMTPLQALNQMAEWQKQVT
ncbi:MAG: DNA mismatch repair protein MutS [Bdellovibrionales bacterium]|nr:DNA mismatch repair protein MutS [Bdellovibrionales bacterium]